MTSFKRHYVDNKTLLAELVKYKESLRQAEKENKPKPRMSNYLGQSFYKIAENFSHTRSFQSYKFKEDMISDGVFYCIKYADSFDPAKSPNAFSYFTQVIYHGFIQRIEREKKYLYTKYKAIEKMETFINDAEGQGEMIKYSEGARENMETFVGNFEKRLSDKKKKNA
jgi:DNA-directed RNA polymerase specialized sigma subunit